MSSALSLIVFAYVLCFGPIRNDARIINNLGNKISEPNTPGSDQIPDIHRTQELPDSAPIIRRPDYTYTPGIGAHKIFDNYHPLDWNDALQKCQAEGGHLAVIDSPGEAELLKSLFAKTRSRKDGAEWDFLHIGFHKISGEWVTIFGDPLPPKGSKEWKIREPNHPDYEFCGSMYLNGLFNDITCSHQLGYICELPYVEEN